MQRNGEFAINIRRFFGHCIKGSDETVPANSSTAIPSSGGDNHDDNTPGKDYFNGIIIRPGPTVCATPITVMGSVMGLFSLCNAVYLVL